MATKDRTTLPYIPQHTIHQRGLKFNRVALYARVSTTNHQNPEMQTRELREYAELRGWHVTDEYVDLGVSGSKESRPALNKLMADAHRRAFDIVLVWKLDRFGRSLKHLVTAIADLEALGLAFVSLRDNLDLTTPSGRLLFQVVGAMSEFERALIQERVRAGLRNARAKGKRIGRPRVHLDVDQIRQFRSQGWGWNRIARHIGVGPGTVLRAAEQFGFRWL
jgi:DNA invertase Pin-like site-specific DNA recombinase